MLVVHVGRALKCTYFLKRITSVLEEGLRTLWSFVKPVCTDDFPNDDGKRVFLGLLNYVLTGRYNRQGQHIESTVSV